MKKTKSPAFQLYPKDLLADTAWLTNEEFGVYVRFLLYAWIGLPGYKQGELPTDPVRLLSLVRLSEADFEQLSKQILPYFTDLGDGRMVQKRMQAEMKKQETFRKAKQKAGLASATARQQKVNRTGTEPQAPVGGMLPTESNSSSSSSSSSSKEENKRAHAAGNGSGTGKSRFTLEECLEYAESEKGIRNPVAYAQTIWRSGDKDALIEKAQANGNNGDRRDEWRGHFEELLRGYLDVLNESDDRRGLIRKALELIPECVDRAAFQSTLDELRSVDLEL